MARVSSILEDIAQSALSRAFGPYQLTFRSTAAGGVQGQRASAAALTGPDVRGRVQLAVEEGVLDAVAALGTQREDLVNELTNVLAGSVESELLRRGLAIRYSTPYPVSASRVSSFPRGSDAVVCIFEADSGRVTVSIELSLGPGAILEAMPTRALPEREAAGEEPVLRKSAPGSVLVVDDSVSARRQVSSALADAGFDVMQVESGEAALQLLKARDDIRMVFTDLHMQGMQGAELVRAIKSDEKLAGIAVAVLTASPGAISKAELSQVLTCLIKPISPAAVISLARRVMSAA